MATHEQLEQAWADLKSRLRTGFPDHVYQGWLASLQPLALEGSTLYLKAPASSRDWIRRRFGSTLNAAAALSTSVERVELVSGERRTDSESETAGVHRARPGLASFKPSHTFDQFVIGEGNRFAHAAALAAAEMPGQAYNPLFIYGPPGVGKTHLLKAIGAYLKTHEPVLAVRYATVEDFTNEFLSALHHKRLDSFKRSYRETDLLLLDDAQFLEGKSKTAEEFFYTFDAISSSGAQIVLSGDRHPSEMPLLEARLRARLQGGLIADLHSPNFETRLAILQKEATSASVSYDLEVLRHLAHKITSNVRILKGALIRLIAFSSLTGEPVTTQLAGTVLSALYDKDNTKANDEDKAPYPRERISQTKSPSLSRIHEATAESLSIPTEDLASPKRTRNVVYARQIAMYLARELTPLSLPAIAREFGGRDHTTVLHAHRKIQAQLTKNEETRSTIDSVLQLLESTS